MVSLLVLIGGFIPILGQIVLIGWSALMMRRAVSGQDSPLPRLDFDFNHLGKLLTGGFKSFLMQLLWTVPLIFVVMTFVCVMYAGGFAMAMSARHGGGNEIGHFLGSPGGIATVIGVYVGLLGFIMIFSLPVQIAAMRVELTDDFAAARFKAVMKTTKLLWKELLVGMFVMLLIRMTAGILGMCLCFVGLYPATAIVFVIQTFWHAELYRVYLEKGGEPLAIGPLDVEAPAAQPVVHAPPPSAF
jgi:hypothetical protein